MSRAESDVRPSLKLQGGGKTSRWNKKGKETLMELYGGKRIARGAVGLAAALALTLCVPGAFAASSQPMSIDMNQELADVMPYAQSYLSGDDSLLITRHKDLGLTCIDCHTTVAADGTTSVVADAGTREACLGCHSDWDDIVASTAGMAGTVTVYNKAGLYNPHDNHRGDANCGDCHKMHEASRLLCVECHNMEVPQGWIGFE